MKIKHVLFVVFFLFINCKKEKADNSQKFDRNTVSSYSENEIDTENEGDFNNYSSEEENEEETKEGYYSSNEEEDEGYKDGKYSANIDYYNPETGASSTYTLNVKVRNERLVEIEWENGGWLDESHFSSVDISDGSASFTDDRGREFDVKLKEFKY